MHVSLQKLLLLITSHKNAYTTLIDTIVAKYIFTDLKSRLGLIIRNGNPNNPVVFLGAETQQPCAPKLISCYRYVNYPVILQLHV